jgi:hypothetical protein
LHVKEAVLSGIGADGRDVLVETARELDALAARTVEYGATAGESRVGTDEAKNMNVKFITLLQVQRYAHVAWGFGGYLCHQSKQLVGMRWVIGYHGGAVGHLDSTKRRRECRNEGHYSEKCGGKLHFFFLLGLGCRRRGR